MEESAIQDRSADENAAWLIAEVKRSYELKVTDQPAEYLDHLERQIILTAIDRLWQEHLYNMDALREGVHLRAQGQKDPLVEYKNEAYSLFETLMDSIKGDALSNLFRSTASLDQFEQLLQSMPQDHDGPEQAQITNANMAQAITSQEVALKPIKSGKNVKIEFPKRKPIQIKSNKKS